jgi:hypothetical protein
MFDKPEPTHFDGDLLRGGVAIRDFLRSLSSDDDWDLEDVYYAHRAKKLPIGKYGKDLISSRSKLVRALQALVP